MYAWVSKFFFHKRKLSFQLHVCTNFLRCPHFCHTAFLRFIQSHRQKIAEEHLSFSLTGRFKPLLNQEILGGIQLFVGCEMKERYNQIGNLVLRMVEDFPGEEVPVISWHRLQKRSGPEVAEDAPVTP